MSAPLHISVFAQNSATAYSGGRYGSLMLAVAMAEAGHRVRYVTNRRPAFYEDLKALPALARVDLRVTGDFLHGIPDGPCDLAVVVPGMDGDLSFYHGILRYAQAHGARVALLNFEDPLWFNALSPAPRDPGLWDPWRLVARHAGLVLSISSEGDRHARSFYTDIPIQTAFEWLYLPINTHAAEAVDSVARERRVLMLTRFWKGEHKGGGEAGELVCDEMRGYVLVLVAGRGQAPRPLLRALHRAGERHGVRVEVKYRLSDAAKFEELRRAALLVFPSRFEGYGYPPVEAQWCGTPCLAFDLPVLRERDTRGMHFVPAGDWAALRRRMGELLRAPAALTPDRAALGYATVEGAAARLGEILPRVMVTPPLTWYEPVAVRRPGLARRVLRRLRG